MLKAEFCPTRCQAVATSSSQRLPTLTETQKKWPCVMWNRLCWTITRPMASHKVYVQRQPTFYKLIHSQTCVSSTCPHLLHFRMKSHTSIHGFHQIVPKFMYKSDLCTKYLTYCFWCMFMMLTSYAFRRKSNIPVVFSKMFSNLSTKVISVEYPHKARHV